MKQLCTATTFAQSNHSGNARGRKLHKTKDKIKTLCNMKVDEIMTAEYVKSTVLHNRTCKICFTPKPTQP